MEQLRRPEAPVRRPARFAATKFAPPRSSAVHVRRPALLDSLVAVDDGAVRAVVGPPGSGKTTLLVDLADRLRPAPVAWVNVDAADRDPVRFWQAAIAAIRHHHPEFGEEVHDLLTLDGVVEADALEALMEEADRLPEPVTVIFDDLHRADGQVDEQLRTVAERSSGLRIVLGARRASPALIGRLRANRRLVLVDESDLQLDLVEARALARGFDQAARLTPAEVDELHRRTEGWVAGMVLALLAIPGQDDPSAFVAQLSGTDRSIAPYLTSELVDAQPSEIRDFLLDTCVVDDLSEPLAARLTDGSPVRLADLEDRHLLLQRLDPGGRSYRYHHLFAELLRARLLAHDPHHASVLHRRAAAWYEEQGDLASCFRHRWRAGDRTEALAVVEAAYLDDYLAGRLHPASEAARALTDADLRADPDSVASLVGALVLEGHIEAGSLLADRLEDVAGAQLSPAARLRFLTGRCFEATALGDVARTARIGAELRALASQLPTDREAVEAGMSIEVRARAWAGALAEAEAIAANLPTLGPKLIEAVDHQSSVAHLRLAQGRLDEAAARSRSALDALASDADHNPDMASLPSAVLGTVLLERGQVDDARPHLWRAIEIASPTRRPATVLALLSAIRLLRSEGELDGAMELLDQGRDLLRHAPPSSPVLLALECSRARTLRRAGAEERSLLTIEAMPPSVERSAVLATHRAAEGDLDGARSALAAAPPTEIVLGALDLALAAVAVELAAGGSRVPQATGAVLDLAGPMGATFAIAEAGPEVLAAVADAGRRRPQTPFLEELARTRPHAAPLATARIEFPVDALSERERTVLQYLATALSYPEIAAELYVSVNTIKTHVKNVLRKLQAGSRAEAVERARELRYL